MNVHPDPKQALLVNLPRTTTGRRSLAGSSRTFTSMRYRLQPIEDGDGPGGRRRTLGASGGPEPWQVATPSTDDAAPEQAWDRAHELADELPNGTFIEPDWDQGEFEPTAPGTASRRRAASAPTRIRFGNDQTDDWAKADSFLWHLDRTGLAAARDRVDFETDDPVRIVHLDTGYSRTHLTRPRHIDRELERNYVEGEPIRDARDPGGRSFPLRQPGHGTATIALLAGGEISYREDQRSVRAAIGGAPSARVVPVRIARSVVHIKTRAMGLGIRYAARLARTEGRGCGVVSISMGGVPSAFWADCVNSAYDAGVCVVAAAGNRMGKSPPSKLVWPARFGRVVAVCGFQADEKPYYNKWYFRTMQGSFGPPGVMDSAIGAYTPNIAWADLEYDDLVHQDGKGTSSATPQVAAAAALWLQHHRERLAEFPNPWQRVEAVRRALFGSAKRVRPSLDEDFQVRGLLRADRALSVQPARVTRPTPVDSVSWPFLRTIFGMEEPSPRDHMLEVEALQLIARTPEFEDHIHSSRKNRSLKRTIAGELSSAGGGVLGVASDRLRRRADAAWRDL